MKVVAVILKNPHLTLSWVKVALNAVYRVYFSMGLPQTDPLNGVDSYIIAVSLIIIEGKIDDQHNTWQQQLPW